MPSFTPFVHPKRFSDCSNQNRGIYTVLRYITTGSLPNDCVTTLINTPVEGVSINGIEKTMAWWWLFYKIEASVTLTIENPGSIPPTPPETITKNLQCIANYNPKNDRICWTDYRYPITDNPENPLQAFLYNETDDINKVSFIFETYPIVIASTDNPNMGTTYNINMALQSHSTLEFIDDSIDCALADYDFFRATTINYVVAGRPLNNIIYFHFRVLDLSGSISISVDNFEITNFELWTPST